MLSHKVLNVSSFLIIYEPDIQAKSTHRIIAAGYNQARLVRTKCVRLLYTDKSHLTSSQPAYHEVGVFHAIMRLCWVDGFFLYCCFQQVSIVDFLVRRRNIDFYTLYISSVCG